MLDLMAQGLSNPLIAQQLFLSLSSVEKHISAIFQKFGLTEDGQVHRRVAAVVAYRNAVTPGGEAQPLDAGTNNATSPTRR